MTRPDCLLYSLNSTFQTPSPSFVYGVSPGHVICSIANVDFLCLRFWCERCDVSVNQAFSSHELRQVKIKCIDRWNKTSQQFLQFSEIRLSSSSYNTGKIITTGNIPDITSLKKIFYFHFETVAYTCCCWKRNGKFMYEDVSLLKCPKWTLFSYSTVWSFFSFSFR